MRKRQQMNSKRQWGYNNNKKVFLYKIDKISLKKFLIFWKDAHETWYKKNRFFIQSLKNCYAKNRWSIRAGNKVLYILLCTNM